MSNNHYNKLQIRASAAPVTVREATADDAGALERLAQLDSARIPSGTTMVAEVGGEVLAALPARGGQAIADPFRPTAELVEMLRVRAGLTSARNGSPIRALGRTRRPRREPRVPRPSTPSVPGIPVLRTPR